MMQGQGAPPGASPNAVGTDAIPTPELPAAGAPEGGAPPEMPGGQAEAVPGETESQNAIMQAMATNPQQQITPEQEEMIKAQLNLAARQRLLGGP